MVGRNLCFNEMKKRKREVTYDESTDVMMKTNAYRKITSVEEEPLERLLKDEKMQVLYQCIRKLDIEKREILELQYFSGVSLKEVAHLTGKSYENVRVLSSRGKRSLREYMEAEGYEL